METPLSSHRNTDKFASYSEFISSIVQHDEQYRWLFNFFNHSPRTGDDNTEINIFDSEGGRLTRKPLQEALQAGCPANVKTRIIVFQYEEVWTASRTKLDNLAFLLNLPPYSLWRHLDHKAIDVEPHVQQDRDEMGPRLPLFAGHRLNCNLQSTRNLAFEHGYWGFQQLSAWVMPCESPSLATIGKNVLHQFTTG